MRKEVLNTITQFNGTFSTSCQVRDLPQSLQTLVAMLCDGASITEQSLATQNQAQLSICQLIVFNSLLRPKKRTPNTRHNKSRGPPLPVYLGIFLHNKTRKRELVDTMHELGLSVSYDRVLEISTDLGTKICKYYASLNTVCPPQLKKRVFTTSAMDNINLQLLQRAHSMVQVSLYFNTMALQNSPTDGATRGHSVVNGFSRLGIAQDSLPCATGVTCVYDKGSLGKVFRDKLVATVQSGDSSSGIVGSLSMDSNTGIAVN